MFKIGRPVKGNIFMDRKKYIYVFKELIDNNQHTTIKAPPRFGKTSFTKHVLESIGGYSYIYVDIRRATDLKSLSNDILDKAYSFVGIDSFINTAKKSFLDIFKTVQKIKIDEIAEVTLKHIEVNINEVDYFLHALDVVDLIAQKKKIKIKFVFDEFQDILNIADKNILDLSHSVMQDHKDITYIFLGSMESRMTNIFESKTSPFFNFSKILTLNGLDVNEVIIYVSNAFKEKKIKFDKKSLIKVLNFLDGHPDYTTQTLQHLYIESSLSGNAITLNECLIALYEVLNSNKAYIEEVLSKVKVKKHHFEVLNALSGNYKIELNSKTLYQVNSSLENLGLVKNIGRGDYKISDILIKIYLQVNIIDYDKTIQFLDKQVLENKKGI